MPRNPDIGADFRALHKPGDPFVLANAWDVGSAQMLVGLGAQAIGTSSAALAFTQGSRDLGHLTRDAHLAHAQNLVAAVPVPVSGDFENGFGDAPETCAETVRLSAEAGLAGICIEDTDLPGTAAYDFDLAVERIRAAAAAARALPKDFFLVARADGVLLGSYDVAEATRRLRAFEQVGADGLYAPGLPSFGEVAPLCSAVSAPVNILVTGPMIGQTTQDFANAGVARLSLGSMLARATHRLIRDTGAAMFDAGDFSGLLPSISGAKVDALMEKGAG